MNRGSASGRAAPRPGEDGFNEAPIHESGKSSNGTKRRIRNGRFNEAPIHESGKYQQLTVERAATIALQ